MKMAFIEIIGKSATWCITAPMSEIQIESMRNDGVDVHEVMNQIPEWAVELGLTRVWCFMQDVWHFRSPF